MVTIVVDTPTGFTTAPLPEGAAADITSACGCQVSRMTHVGGGFVYITAAPADGAPKPPADPAEVQAAVAELIDLHQELA
jgi:hypothetical protein